MRRSLLLAFAVLIVATLCAPRTASSAVDPRAFGGMHWRLLGPFRGGRAVAVAGVAGDPTVAYFGAVDGGVWKTDDAGRTWDPIFDGQPIGSIGAIAVAASDAKTIYVGSGEADMRSDISYGDGMYKSTDGGSTWSHVGLDDSRQIARIVIDPSNANRVFVAVLGHGYGPNSERGIYRSVDGGAHWQRVLYKDENTGAVDLAMDPHDPQTLLAALWQTRRPPWNIYPPSNGPGSGLYVTHDGGDTWQQIAGGFPTQGLGRMGIAFAPSDPQRVYAIVDAKAGGLYRSEDGGNSWRRENAEVRLWQRGWYFCSIAVDPANADTLYISDTAFYRSTDGGAHFTPIKGSPDGDDFHGIWVDPSDGRRIVLGSDQGTSITLNGGRTWSSWFNQPTAQFYHIIADDRYPFDVFGAQQDSGTALVPVASDRLGIMAQDWRPIDAGGESGYVAVDPANPDFVYGDNVTKENIANRQSMVLDPTVTVPAVYRSQWTLPLVFSPTKPNVLYYGRQMLFRTTDAGDTWKIISPDLTRPDPPVPGSLDGPTVADNDGTGPRRGVIYTIAPSPVRDGVIWCGTDDGKIWTTSDGGGNWHDVTPAAVGPWSSVDLIEASAFDPQTAYAAVDRHRVDDIHPYIYRTRDGGRTWRLVADGIPDGAYVFAVREDPAREGLLYAGTELGLYVSFDDGASWQPLQLNLPVAAIHDMAIQQDTLVVATHGRAFWALDDLAPLHQLPDSGPLSTTLFKPEPATRLQPHLEPGERVPPEEPQGENRPVGAMIDYVLASAPHATVTLSVRDAAGSVVRTYSSAERPPIPDTERLDFPLYWAQVPAVLPATIGMHRFLWDFHYAALPGEDAREGPFAPPGSYSVQLTVDGKTYSRPLTVVRDP
ncbi:MAG TPA: hypothetical protein VEJ20_03915, partial [Candidatus Eremiobacteraceae bacterium]|nr:hypothetical protein [Candidatus Eremiobacteraceae bacterium]